MLADSGSVETFLRHLDLFEGLDADDLHRIVAGAVLLDAGRGTVVLHRGETSIGMYIVLCGQLKISLRCADRPEKVIAVLAAGDLFGETALFRVSGSIVDVQCLADSKLLIVGRETVLAEIEAIPRLARNLARHLSKKVHELTLDIEAHTLCTGTERVVAYLLRALRVERPQGHQRLVLDTRKNVIASQLNLTQEHFSRILHDLVEARLIQVNGLEVVIPDVERLRPCSCDSSPAILAQSFAWSARVPH